MFIGRKTQYCKVSVLPNMVSRLNAIPVKIPVSYSVDINKLILKFIWRGKRSRIANTVLKNNKVRAFIIKAVCIGERIDGPVEQNKQPRNRPT